MEGQTEKSSVEFTREQLRLTLEALHGAAWSGRAVVVMAPVLEQFETEARALGIAVDGG